MVPARRELGSILDSDTDEMPEVKEKREAFIKTPEYLRQVEWPLKK